MIQDIAPKKFDNQYRNTVPKNEDKILCFFKNMILVKEGETLDFPTYHQYEKAAGKQEDTYLFAIDETSFFMVEGSDSLSAAGAEAPLPKGYQMKTINSIRGYGQMDMMLAAATGWHLYTWYRNNHYCGRCGGKTIHDDKERMLRCSCGNLIYPKVAPAVIVAITDGNRILLSTYAGRAYKRYALIAGFTEIGETMEETVEREVMEEVGLKVKNIRYYKSQPWGFDSNVLMGYFCQVDGSRQLTIDTDELSGAQWVEREDIPDYNEGISLTHEMMMVFKHREV